MTKRRRPLIKVHSGAESDQEISDASVMSGRTPPTKKVRWRGRSGGELKEEPSSDSEAERESSVAPEKTCLAAFSSHGSMGCAYYDPKTRILSVLEDTQETTHYDITEMLLEQLDPEVVLTSSKSEDGFIDALTENMEKRAGMFQIRPFKEFAVSRGKDRLLSLTRLSALVPDDSNLPPSSDADFESHSSRHTNAYDFMRSRRQITGDPTTRRWNASIRMSNFTSVESSPLCLSSIGALLDYIVRERALSDFDDEGISGLDVRDIEILALNQFMQINADALMSLQVFENESHASVHSDKTKEGLSVFGMLNNTRTTLGRSHLRSWLLRPSLSLSVINARHDAVECFALSENIVTANAMHNHLKGLKNMPRIMAQLRSGKGKLADWQGLVKFTFHATMLREGLSELHQGCDVEVVRQLIEVLDVAAFKEIGIKINDIIDWEESSTNDRVCVRPNVDEDLDNRKHVYHGIDSVLSNVAEQVSQTVPSSYATSLNVVYFPQLGYLICVPMTDEWRTEPGIQPLEGWTFQFSSDEHVYFKSAEMHDMDHHIGDLHSTIVDRELEIIQALLEEVLECDAAIASACDVSADLDCLLSFAEASRLYNFRRPDMVEDNHTEIIQGRHPLYETVVDTFVPNDARLMGGAGVKSDAEPPDKIHQWNSVLLCTGANACGKSVYMKQIAIIQIMAESATLGLVDKIFTRVSTRESVSKTQSAFMIDLAQVSLALRNCTARSLIILDEFGKGTLSTGSSTFLVFNGAGLFCGVLRHLLRRGSSCPRVLVATHFHDVFNDKLLDPENVPISFRHMQVMFTSRTGQAIESTSGDNSTGASCSEDTFDSVQDGSMSIAYRSAEKITYLYRVAEGLSLDSHAAKCAELFGIPSKVVKRAQYISKLVSSHELGKLLDEEMLDTERQELEEAESVCRRFLAWKIKQNDDEDLGTGEVKRKLAEILGFSVDD
ncbi:DNA mismatch repair protein MutS [Crepidotus variabilis]|uniref:DNA mismatch repair protein MutS n=1 Tax=Crepidotus variabilis TaxID=179855 RepID=A0A9P6EQE0_9AGAR|nr:DNA mismatch repair protein MutS [Crepidotus variabilis]